MRVFYPQFASSRVAATASILHQMYVASAKELFNTDGLFTVQISAPTAQPLQSHIHHTHGWVCNALTQSHADGEYCY